MAKLRITQKRSIIKRIEKQKRTIKALGLGRPNRSVVHEDTPQIRGMIRVVQHLVEVEEIND
ncbi:MAG: 50S ribosomal protein L30 [Chlorobi bacterium]|nr:50S ribosomal protein L30 [Chlorobiota bacterium]